MIYDTCRSAEEREIFTLECFSNRLRNKALATALKMFKPKTLAEAMKMIKNEEKELIEESFDIVNEIAYSCDYQV